MGAELAKISQTQDELLGHLEEQIIFLINSSKSFDDGFQCEAKRVATTIRVLLHDNPPHSVSLLTQLNKKNIRFYDTASDIDPCSPIPQWVLLVISLRSGQYVAPLNNLPPNRSKQEKVSFDEW